MGEPVETLYFDWLCAKVLPMDSPVYVDLLHILYETEFTWTILGDRNREEDGCELREDFLRETGLRVELHENASVLEVLIAFASRAEFQTDISTNEWFWIFMNNLRLDEFRHVNRFDIRAIKEILSVFVRRTYDHRGNGGLFPMRRPRSDQREVEIWYQFCEYLDDQGLV